MTESLYLNVALVVGGIALAGVVLTLGWRIARRLQRAANMHVYAPCVLIPDIAREGVPDDAANPAPPREILDGEAAREFIAKHPGQWFVALRRGGAVELRAFFYVEDLNRFLDRNDLDLGMALVRWDPSEERTPEPPLLAYS